MWMMVPEIDRCFARSGTSCSASMIQAFMANDLRKCKTLAGSAAMSRAFEYIYIYIYIYIYRHTIYTQIYSFFCFSFLYLFFLYFFVKQQYNFISTLKPKPAIFCKPSTATHTHTPQTLNSEGGMIRLETFIEPKDNITTNTNGYTY